MSAVDARLGSFGPRSPTRDGLASGLEKADCGAGLRLCFNADTAGFSGIAFGRRGGAPGGLGAEALGAVGMFLDVSGSDRYGESVSRPVLTPPDFRSFGMPPENIPPSWGAPDIALSLPETSLLARALFPSGLLGANPPGAFGTPGTGGAPIAGPTVFFLSFPVIGADLSFVTAFFSLVPFSMSPSNAP